MAGDNLFAILAMIRAELPDVPDATWDQIRHLIGTHAGGSRVYVPAASSKRDRLERLAHLAADADAQQISKALGVSVVHARRLKRLR